MVIEIVLVTLILIAVLIIAIVSNLVASHAAKGYIYLELMRTEGYSQVEANSAVISYWKKDDGMTKHMIDDYRDYEVKKITDKKSNLITRYTKGVGIKIEVIRSANELGYLK